MRLVAFFSKTVVTKFPAPRLDGAAVPAKSNAPNPCRSTQKVLLNFLIMRKNLRPISQKMLKNSKEFSNSCILYATTESVECCVLIWLIELQSQPGSAAT